VTLRQGYDRVLETSGTLVGMVYGLIALLMTVDIGIRAANLGALAWLTELTEYLMYAGTFLAAAWALRQGAHVRVDVLLTLLPRRAAAGLDIAMDALGFAIAAVFLWYGSIALADAWGNHNVQYKTWAVPEWLLLAAIPVGAVLLMVEFALRLRRAPGVLPDFMDPTRKGGF
jgi:TRAP-type C4-dicarboxylate transport system permease small subunit